MRRPPSALPAAGVGIASQKPFFERISGPASCAPTITGAFDQTSAAAFRLTPAFGNTSDRIELASRGPSPAPTICPRQASFSPVPASRIAAVTARSPAAISAAIIATRSGSDVELQLHAGLTSSVQTSRSRSRTGSPWMTKVSPSSTSRSPGRGAGDLAHPQIERASSPTRAARRRSR